jgi:hypothetical protein
VPVDNHRYSHSFAISVPFLLQNKNPGDSRFRLFSESRLSGVPFVRVSAWS